MRRMLVQFVVGLGLLSFVLVASAQQPIACPSGSWSPI